MRFAPLFLTAMIATAAIQTVKPTLDVGLSVVDIDKSKAFYGGVLGLNEITPMKLPDGTTLTRFQAGTAVIKMRAFPNAAKFPGGTRTAIGIRLLTFYFADITSIVKRWTDLGNPAPALNAGITAGSKYGIISDPDGNQVEIVQTAPGTDMATLDKIAIGLTVQNVERSREFYGKTLGLTEEEPYKMATGAMEYRFLAGKTEIKFWAGPADAPKHTGSIPDTIGFRYFTFLIPDVEPLHAEFAKKKVHIVREPYDLATIARIIIAADPDGNIIEFAARKTR